jgi:hypothetical protein
MCVSSGQRRKNGAATVRLCWNICSSREDAAKRELLRKFPFFVP